MTSLTSQEFESYLPVYDAIPEDWEASREFLVEHLKKISNAVNAREIGFFLDEELLSGKAFIPGVNISGTSQQFRTILRKVVDLGALVAGASVFPHGVTNDANLTNIQYWVSATNSATLTDITMVYPEVVIVGPNVNITSPGIFDRAFFFWEYIQEL
jgi:hypothetical protein